MSALQRVLRALVPYTHVAETDSNVTLCGKPVRTRSVDRAFACTDCVSALIEKVNGNLDPDVAQDITDRLDVIASLSAPPGDPRHVEPGAWILHRREEPYSGNVEDLRRALFEDTEILESDGDSHFHEENDYGYGEPRRIQDNPPL